MNVLSLFDGMSCGRIALERAGVEVGTYYSSEIDKYAIKVADQNWPEDKAHRLGDVTKCRTWDIDWSSIDLVLAGSPCQSISNLGDGSGLQGKSGLFYTFFEILSHIRKCNHNVKFILENVSGKKDSIDEITKQMGVAPVMINSNLVSAQNRKRLYWTNINFEMPRDKGINLVDILEEGVPKDSILSIGRKRWLLSDKGVACLEKRYASIDPTKAACLTARSDASWNSNYVTRNGDLTKLTPVEYERLQTVPDNYTACVSNSQRYKMLGNGWTVDVITTILKGLFERGYLEEL
jgi:site-specific DNA-cytosine methylase